MVSSGFRDASVILIILLVSHCQQINCLPSQNIPSNITYQLFAKEHIPNKLTDSIGQLMRAGECIGCDVVVEMSKFAIHDQKAFKRLFETICTLLGIEERTICDDVATLNTPFLKYILINTKESGAEICSIMLEQCSSKVEHQYKSMTLPTRLQKRTVNSTMKSTENTLTGGKLRALWLSDVHLDPLYKETSFGQCKEPLCCRKTSSPKGLSPLVSKWGFVGSCDMPVCTFCNLSAYINTMENAYDYIVFTGDISPHDVWQTTRESAINNTRRFAKLINALKKSDTFVPVIGNHEISPVNLFGPSNIEDESLSTQWLYENLYTIYKSWIPESSKESFLKGGYYVKDLTDKIRLIVLNTNFCQRLNFWNWYKRDDLGDQLKWLVEKLTEAEQEGKYVHLLGHIAPDLSQCDSLWTSRYIRIIERFNETISAQLFGHTHYDEFRTYYNNAGKLIGSAIIGGSFTTFESVNPNFKIFTIDEKGFIQDIDTYYTDLMKAVLSPIEWKKSYTTRQAYELADLTTANLDILRQRISANSTLFDEYYRNYHRRSASFKACDKKCQQKILADLIVTDPLPSK